MKNTKKCPKCGGSDIIFVPGSAGAYGTGNNIMTALKLSQLCRQCLLIGIFALDVVLARSGLTLTTWIN